MSDLPQPRDYHDYDQFKDALAEWPGSRPDPETPEELERRLEYEATLARRLTVGGVARK